MADSVTTQTIQDNRRNTIMRFTNLSDGTGEAAVTKVTMSTLANVDNNQAPTELKIERIDYNTSGMEVEILWDANTPVVASIIGSAVAGNMGVLDFTRAGCIKNNAGAGKTGNIKFTTKGAGANSTYDITLYMKKS